MGMGRKGRNFLAGRISKKSTPFFIEPRIFFHMQVEGNWRKSSQFMKRSGPAASGPSKKRRLSLAQSQEVQREVARQIARKQDYKQTIYNATTTVGYAGVMFPLLTNLTRGDNAVDNFEGAFIQPKSVHLRMQFSAFDLSNLGRFILFQWNDSTVPVPVDILAQTSGPFAPLSYRNWSSKPLYKILRDVSQQTIANPTYTGGNGPVVQFDMFVKGKSLQRVDYNATAATIYKGGLYLLAISDSSVVTHPAFLITSEIIFTDE